MLPAFEWRNMSENIRFPTVVLSTLTMALPASLMNVSFCEVATSKLSKLYTKAINRVPSLSLSPRLLAMRSRAHVANPKLTSGAVE